MRRASGQTLYAAVEAMTGKAKSNLTAFVKLIDTLRTETADLPLSEIVDAVIQQSGLIAHYQAEREGEERIENLNELVNAAAAFVMEEGYDAGTPGTTPKPRSYRRSRVFCRTRRLKPVTTRPKQVRMRCN